MSESVYAIRGVKKRWIWGAWFLLLVIPTVALMVQVVSTIEQRENLMKDLIRRRLIDDMRVFLSEMSPKANESPEDERFIRRIHEAFLHGKGMYPGIIRKKALAPEGIAIPGFVENESEMAFYTYCSGELFRFFLRENEGLRVRQALASEPLVLLKNSVPAGFYEHPLRGFRRPVFLTLFLALAATGLILFCLLRASRGIRSGLLSKVSLLFGAGFLIPFIGCVLAIGTVQEYQKMFSRGRLMDEAVHVMRVLESRLQDCSSARGQYNARLSRRLVPLAGKSGELKEFIGQAVQRGVFGEARFLSRMGMDVYERSSGIYRVRQDKALSEIEEKFGAYLARDFLKDHGFSASGEDGITMAAFSDKLFMDVFIESSIEPDALGKLMYSDGCPVLGVSVMSYGQFSLNPVPSFLPRPPVGVFLSGLSPSSLWHHYLQAIFEKSDAGKSGFRLEFPGFSLELAVFETFFRHKIEFQRTYPAEMEKSTEFYQLAEHTLKSTGGAITDLLDAEMPRIYAFRPLQGTPYTAGVRIVPEAGWLSEGFQHWPGLVGYAIFFLGMTVSVVVVFILRPIHLFSKVAGRIEAGDFRVRAGVKTGDELEDVAEVMNSTAAALEEKKRMARYVSAQAMEAVRSEEKFQSRVERRDMTILFSHVKGFSTLVAEQSPDELLRFLNLYFSRMGQAIRRHHGQIDKFIGDAIMAVFPEDPGLSSAALRGCRAALEMHGAMQDMNALRLSQKRFTVNTGIGLNSGNVISGRIGSHVGRQDFTVIGDAVNLAARLESHSLRAIVSGIVVSQSIVLQVGERLPFHTLGEIPIKGKAVPEKVSELLLPFTPDSSENSGVS
jgi:class 3 adenylate cyclase